MELQQYSKVELHGYSLYWFEHLVSNHDMSKWPQSMIRMTIEDGPVSRMRPRNVVRFVLFFLGNWATLLCAGTWILVRLASNAQSKDRKAKRAIVRFLNVHKMETTVVVFRANLVVVYAVGKR